MKSHRGCPAVLAEPAARLKNPKIAALLGLARPPGSPHDLGLKYGEVRSVLPRMRIWTHPACARGRSPSQGVSADSQSAVPLVD